MEVVNTLLQSTPKFIPANFCIPIGKNKARLCFYKSSNPKLHPFPLFSTCFPSREFSTTPRLRVSAQFGSGRHSTGRRNYLRNKLIDEQKVRETSFLTCPDEISDHIVVKDDTFDKNVDSGVSSFELLGNSDKSSRLDNWVDQYKKDVEFWGVGSGNIFTVIRDSDGNVKKVEVDEDEILRRNESKFLDSSDVSAKTLCAKRLAKEMESGQSVIPENSSVAKFVNLGGEGDTHSFIGRIQGFLARNDNLPTISRIGIIMLCGICLFWTVNSMFSSGKEEMELTRLEKEMLRRKLKARMEKEELEKRSVEVVHNSFEESMKNISRPKLDKDEVINSISVVKASSVKLAVEDSSNSLVNMPGDFSEKILEIRKMAREARELEGKEFSPVEEQGENNEDVGEELSSVLDSIGQPIEERTSSRYELASGDSEKIMGSVDRPINSTSSVYLEEGDHGEVVLVENGEIQVPLSPNGELLDNRFSTSDDLKENLKTSGLDARQLNQSSQLEERSSGTEPKVILSVKEAREYLSRKNNKLELDQEPQVQSANENVPASILSTYHDSNEGERVGEDEKGPKFSGISDANNGYDGVDIQSWSNPGHEEEKTSSSVAESPKDNWMEKNFHEFEPVVEKIRSGFRDNYMVAKEKASAELSVSSDLTQIGVDENDGELEWMKDDHLCEIVFRVRENELAGREPFYMMKDEEKKKFFEGLEKKVEKESKKLLKVHEYLHSNIENLDYGADGVSMFDPLEKIIPRWKSPPLENAPEFLNNLPVQQNSVVAGNAGTSHNEKVDEVGSHHKSIDSPSDDKSSENSRVYDAMKNVRDRTSKGSNTVIEASDGSVRVGKKAGREFWQHTKKWSRGFIDSYSAETDPEVKSVMKDIGKDLDRWITEKEIQEAAELIDKMPEQNKKFIEKKLHKLKREMELFGPQAVVSKYREYAEEKEEDYLWWLDLPCVLCIELYTKENEEQKIGFYSLEMAVNLELEPKPRHVIAFENSVDCKNMCYIIQAHMEMLGNGLAFVVARPPKDTFREAKANGFSVTVLRKGELQLNVDQPLEDVEEQITEIGSKIYHDQIMKERSVDTSALMKGVFGFGQKQPTKRKRPKRKLKRARKPNRST